MSVSRGVWPFGISRLESRELLPSVKKQVILEFKIYLKNKLLILFKKYGVRRNQLVSNVNNK